jgi:penicillin-binding protein 2
LLALMLAAAGCTGSTTTPTPPRVLPTLFPSPTPPGFTLEDAERVAGIFLSAWQQFDYDTMHRHISYAAREAAPLERFKQTYETAHTTMTLERLVFRGLTIARDPANPRVAYFTYDLDFETRLVGGFSETERSLPLTFDANDSAWRVAWTPGVLFAELDRGGELRLETTPSNRANIYDRSGVVLAAQEERGIVTVNIVRREIADAEACMNVLTQATGLSIDVIRARFNTFAADWVNEIGTMEPQAYVQWEPQLVSLCKATFGNRPARVYPNGNLAPHIIGSVGYPDEAQLPDLIAAGFTQDSILGKSGVEARWDEVLRGTPGTRLLIQTPRDGARLIASRPAEVAQSVWLTLDADLQQHILDLLTANYSRNADGWARSSKGAAAIVMDVNTGEILAMVSYPTYDLNAFTPFPSIGRQQAQEIVRKTQEDERQPLLNRAAQGIYPTGSVMKIATAMAAADSGAVNPATRFTCFGNGTFNRDIPRRDWLAEGHGTLTMSGAITQSCNPFFYEAGYQMDLLDPWTFPDHLKRFGLGEFTGMTDIAEAKGLIGNPDWKRQNRGLPWTFSDAVDMSIGQGLVEVTPLQVVRMVAAVANGGTLYKPLLVKKSGLLNEFSWVAEPEPMDTLGVTPEILDMVRLGMCDVTTKQWGTAEFVFRDSPLQATIAPCGKTGTAEDTPRTSHAWFAAFAPAEAPQIAVIVVVENAGEGSAVAAPIARDIMEYYFLGEDVPNAF